MSDAEHPDWGEERRREVRWFDPAAILPEARRMSGLDYFRGVRDGIHPAPPIAALLGMTVTEVEEGEVAFTMEPDESMYNPIGVVHGGIACTMLDTVTGCAVHTTLAPGWGYTSIDLTVSYLRPVTLASGLLTFRGHVVKSGRRVAFAAAEGVDASGAVVATATSSLLVIPPA